jgi:Secretion system C-terminal sorting domain
MRKLTTSPIRVMVAALLLCLSVAAHAQLTVTGGQTATQLLNCIKGTNVTVSNATYTGAATASGKFNSAASNVGLTDGILLTTGGLTAAIGPNNSPSTTVNHGLSGDAALSSLIGGWPTKDAAILEFDVSTTETQLSMNYVFASEEYFDIAAISNEDVMGIFISGGTEYTVPKNMAVLPNSSTYISSKNVDMLNNPAYFIGNTMGDASAIQYDGKTVKLCAKAAVTPGTTYHIRIAIADAEVEDIDSGVFIEASSLKGKTCNPVVNNMICHNMVNVGLDTLCKATVTPKMLLSGAAYTCYDAFEVIINNGLNTGNMVCGADAGKTYTVSVVHTPTGNSCWGKIKVEDKLAPILHVGTKPINLPCAAPNLKIVATETVAFDNIPNNGIKDTAITVFGRPLVREDCNGYTLFYSDVVTDYDCVTNADTSAVVIRTWRAVDAVGNQTSISCRYNLIRGKVSDVLFPLNKHLECTDTFPKDAAGHPSPFFTGIPKINGVGIYPNGQGFCELNTNYSDQVVAGCGNGQKILRTWTVLDWCQVAHPDSPMLLSMTQQIDISDTQAPVFKSCPLPNLEISTLPNSCFGSYITQNISVTDNCTAKPKIQTRLLDVTGLIPMLSGDTMTNIPIGKYVLEYTASDECGNAKTCTRNLEVKDNVPPTAICDLDTKIALTVDGTAVVYAKSFDDGSKDNCCLDINRFEVKRADQSDSYYGKSVTFYCSDKNIMVQLRVWDCYNNSNTCMVNAVVEDKLSPVVFADSTFVRCGNATTALTYLNAHPPKLKTVNDYPTAKNPGYFDNCEAYLSYKDEGSINNCGVGKIVRIWTATDNSKNTATARQVYFSVNRSAYQVEFPKDSILICNASGKYSTDVKDMGSPKITMLELPNATDATTCSMPSIDHEDQVFNSVPGACYKIIRTWKVLNMCQNTYLTYQDLQTYKGTGDPYRKKAANGTCEAPNWRVYTNISPFTLVDPLYIPLVAEHSCYNFDYDGYMEYKQVIMVNDNTAPTIDSIPPAIVEGTSTCGFGTVKIGLPKGSDCSSQIGFSFTTDIPGYNTTINTVLPITLANVPYGKYTITYRATDNCGNFSTKSSNIIVNDTKKPTALCHDNLAIQLMPSGMAMLPAHLLDGGSSDNCTPHSKLKFRIQVPAPQQGEPFNIAHTDTTYTFFCPLQAPTTPDQSQYVLVALWVGDEDGNWEYCSTYVNIQDNQKLCLYNEPLEMYTITGAIATEQNKPVSKVSVELNGMKGETQPTATDGCFSFKDKPFNNAYTVTPSKDDDPSNGVSTFDLVLLSKHILNIQPLATPYQLIAADINKSGTITTFDMVELRKLILKINAKFTNNTSWRFVPKSEIFADPKKPWSFTEKMQIANLTKAEKLDYVAIKIGDINGNAQTNGQAAPRNGNSLLTVHTDDATLNVGETTRVTLSADEATHLEGYQFTLNYDKSKLELLDIEGNQENFGILEDGIITTSWNGRLSSNEALFTLVFRAKREGLLSESLHLNSSITAAEAYTTEAEVMDLALAFNQKYQPSTFELYQNMPNPFNGTTAIGFNLPTKSEATLTILDATGKRIKVIQNTFNKGYNAIYLDKLELGATGVFYYRLETEQHTATKKMVIIE